MIVAEPTIDASCSRTFILLGTRPSRIAFEATRGVGGPMAVARTPKARSNLCDTEQNSTNSITTMVYDWFRSSRCCGVLMMTFSLLMRDV